jgi:signal transduction histidine kinase
MGRGYQRAPFRTRAWGYAVAMTIVAGLLALHGLMMVELAKRSSHTSEREAQLYAFALTERLLHRQGYDFVEDVMRGSEVPFLFTRMDGTPVHWRNLHWKGSDLIPEALPYNKLHTSEKEAIDKFLRGSQKMGRVRPIVIGGTPVGLLYHGDYNIRQQLYGLLGGGAVAIMLLAGLTWFGLKIMQGTERSLLWVGMARETAHQLGTPISALVGWIEYMRLKSPDIPQLGRLANEMDRDLGRLRQVVDRFSQIGSLPELHLQDPNNVIRFIADYFTPRLPKEDRKVVIDLDLQVVADIPLNRELFGWVLENLIKNALDAMERKDGRITITSRATGRLGQDVRIDVEDNGRGIPAQHQRDVFLPGWTSKKRGWGLGLALARRIVEQYHGGKIWLDYSRLGEGTGFSILLRDPSALDRNRSGAA